MQRRDFFGLILGLGLGLIGHDAFAERAGGDRTFTIVLDEVSYTLPLMSFLSPPPPASPFVYQYEFMYLRIADRELIINGVSRYKAQPGDKVTVTYIPNIITVNGKPLPN